jgi:sialate O-acetylesterase
MYKSHEIHDNYAEVSFHFAENGWYNKEGDNIEGFAIAGQDSVFHWANVKLVGSTVVLSSDQVQNPIEIRYAWADNPKVTLYNSEGLPVIPFRTDDW